MRGTSVPAPAGAVPAGPGTAGGAGLLPGGLLCSWLLPLSSWWSSPAVAYAAAVSAGLAVHRAFIMARVRCSASGMACT